MSAPRYVATFEPQAWINDYAVAVDAEGETAWDCTDYLRQEEGLEAEVRAAIAEEGYWLDQDDVFAADPAAPAWVRDWHGPFTITIVYEEH